MLLLLVILIVVLLLCVVPLYLLRDKAFLERVSTGRAGRLVNFVCSCPVLLYQAFAIYMRPCIRIYVADLLDGVLCAPLRFICCKCCCQHRDKKFPPAPSSIGEWEGKSIKDEDVVWMRAGEFLGEASGAAQGGGATSTTEEEGTAGKKQGGLITGVFRTAARTRSRVKLFEGQIEPKDVGQGSVGNCWLIAAFACAAEHPGLITRTFVTERANQRGKYKVRLWDWQSKRFVIVGVDENLPTQGGKSLFAQPHGREIWVAILEKAFAKFVGSYGALDGGQTAWGLNALTGDPVFILQKSEDGWERIDMRAKADDKNKRAVEFVGRSPPEIHGSAALFFVIRRYARQKALMGASFGSYGGGGGEGLNGEDMGPQGLVSGHAYSVLDAKRFHTKEDGGEYLMLVQLRNPWGRGEWEGAWSDNSDCWGANISVRDVIRPKQEDDGIFWMSWTDFVRIFTRVDICARTTGVQDLRLSLKEADGCLSNCAGPMKGCCLGCTAFWCCCRGCAALYGEHGGSDVTIDIQGDEKSAFDDNVTSRLGRGLEDMAATVQAI
jgi:hypothetical protein